MLDVPTAESVRASFPARMPCLPLALAKNRFLFPKPSQCVNTSVAKLMKRAIERAMASEAETVAKRRTTMAARQVGA